MVRVWGSAELMERQAQGASKYKGMGTVERRVAA
jgi:hypothetical protein